MDDLDFQILAGICQHQRLAIDFSFQYDEKLFRGDYQKLAKSLISYAKTFKSKPSRKSMVERHSSELELIEQINDFFDNAEQYTYNDADYGFDIVRLKDRYSTAIINNVKEKLIEDSTDYRQATKELQKGLNEIHSLSGNKAYERSPVRDYVDKFVKNFQDKAKNKDLGRGIMTGYSFLDFIKNGLFPADLVIIAGESGSGKSLFMNNIAINVWMQQNTINTPKDQFTKGFNVAYFSLEMPYEDCYRRTISKIADVPAYGVRDARLNRSEAAGLNQACKFMKHYPYVFDIIDVPRGFSVEQLELSLEEIKSSYTPDVIFIDYMGLMEDASESDDDDWLTLGKIAGKIHEVARAYQIPIVSAVQLNRVQPGTKNAIGMHRIGRSALIATHCTLIIQIETRADESTHDDFIYHIIKNRNGESGKSHTIYKNFPHSSLIDKQYDSEEMQLWTANDNISIDVSDILGNLD